MIDFKNKQILFFAPKFFNYDIEIKNKLIELGATVYHHDERPSNNFLTKLLIRLNPNLLSNYIKKYFTRIASIYDQSDFDFIFFFKGETISQELILSLKEKFPQAKVILYLIDSLKNYPHIIKCLDLFDKTLTFDHNDSEKYTDLIFRPLFFSDVYREITPSNQIKKSYDLLFIGTVHSDRWSFLNRIKSSLSNKGFKVYYYLYFQSVLIFLFRRIFFKSYWSIPLSSVKFKSLTKDEIVSLIEKSNIIIDIQHPNQSGLTMRTIEVLGSNRKLITTNLDIRKYDFFNQSNILIVDRTNPTIDYNFIHTNYIPPSRKIYEKYSITNWLLDILG